MLFVSLSLVTSSKEPVVKTPYAYRKKKHLGFLSFVYIFNFGKKSVIILEEDAYFRLVRLYVYISLQLSFPYGNKIWY